ncbi:MAG TPA: class I SAM-dependent methyltransferase, partial [Polyangia bacterium]
YFAIRLARAGAHVFAVEVEPQLLELLRDRVRDAGATDGVTPVFGLPDDPLVPPASCDLALVVDTFHHFPDGVAYLRRLARALRPGGRLVNIDFHKRELPVGPPLPHKVAREEFLRAADAAGLALVREETFLPYQYFLELRTKR